MMIKQVLQQVLPVPQLSFVVVGAQFACQKFVEANSTPLLLLSNGQIIFLSSCVGGRAHQVTADNVGGYAFTSCDIGYKLHLFTFPLLAPRPRGLLWQEDSSHDPQRNPSRAFTSRTGSSRVIP